MKLVATVLAALAIIIGGYFGNFKSPKPPEADLPFTGSASSTASVVWQETYAWGQLQNLLNNCKLYWEREDTSCNLEDIKERPYYYQDVPSDRDPEEGRVEVNFISGDPESFEATARHEKSQIIWTIDADGETTCSLGSANACWNASHFSKKEVIDEVKSVFGDDVPDNARSVEFKGTPEEPYAEFK